jgi:GNAT superfamily N-acetyltransferase
MSHDDRTTPSRIRLTGLQEAQLPDLVKLDEACARMYYEIGFDGAEVPVRSQADLGQMTRTHNVHVAEADHVVAGFLAWRDESPGVAYLADVSVHPDYQRFGVASHLLEALRNEARGLKLEHIVARCWERATWAMSFYRRQRFIVIDPTAPPKVLAWKDERLATGRPLTRPGEVALWSPVGPAPKIDVNDDDTLMTGFIPDPEE